MDIRLKAKLNEVDWLRGQQWEVSDEPVLGEVVVILVTRVLKEAWKWFSILPKNIISGPYAVSMYYVDKSLNVVIITVNKSTIACEVKAPVPIGRSTHYVKPDGSQIMLAQVMAQLKKGLEL